MGSMNDQRSVEWKPVLAIVPLVHDNYLFNSKVKIYLCTKTLLYFLVKYYFDAYIYFVVTKITEPSNNSESVLNVSEKIDHNQNLYSIKS